MARPVGVRRIRRPTSRRVRWLVGAAVVVVAVPLLLVAAGATWLLAEDAGTAAPGAHGTGSDALWLGHDWVTGHYTPAELDGLVTRIRSAGIHDLFVHTGPFSDDGSLDPGLRAGAGALLSALHEQVPAVRVQAWLGDVVGPSRLDVGNTATRTRMLGAVAQVLHDGFDGVHLDLEPVPDGDRSYLTLLAAAHAVTRRHHAVLSVAADQLEPVAGARIPAQWVTGRPHFWSTGFLREVAADVDQVAIMAYDSGVPVGAAYSGYVRVQTRLAMTVTPTSVDLLIGVPAYHTDEPGHTSAETVAASVRGVRLAWGPRPVGVALYADFSATPSDWAAYYGGWVAPGAD